MAIPYDYYRLFYYVAQCHSFTRAATVLENNQPNITRCMNNLEQELGCKLFVRSHLGISLTPEGERLYQRVAAAYEQLRLGEEEIQRDCSLESGTLFVGVSEAALHLTLLEKLSAFHDRYPGVRLRLTNDSTPQAIAALRGGHADLAVVTTPFQAPKPLRSTPLLRFREILICGRQHQELAQVPVSLRELAGQSFICIGSGSGTYDFYQQLFTRNNLPFRVDMEAATMDQVLPMIRCGLGIGFCPEAMAAPAIAAGDVCRIPLRQHIPERNVCLIEDDSRPQSVAMKALKDLLCADAGAQSPLE